jgi:hypothetical protein
MLSVYTILWYFSEVPRTVPQYQYFVNVCQTHRHPREAAYIHVKRDWSSPLIPPRNGFHQG